MLSNLVAGASGIVIIVCGLLVLVRTHGLTLAAGCGMTCELVGAITSALAWHGDMPVWCMPIVGMLAAVVVWALVSGRKRSSAVARATGWGDLT